MAQWSGRGDCIGTPGISHYRKRCVFWAPLMITPTVGTPQEDVATRVELVLPFGLDAGGYQSASDRTGDEDQCHRSLSLCQVIVVAAGG